MQTIKVIFDFFIKLIGGIIGMGMLSIAAILYTILGTITGLFFTTAIIYWLYSLIASDIIILPIIGFWSWLKIIIIIRLLFGRLKITPINPKITNKFKNKVKERTKTIDSSQ